MSKTPNNYVSVCIYLALAVATLVVFWPVYGFDFLNYDDLGHITENRHVAGGLSLDGVIWAFTTNYFGNWHPMLWLSYMLDCQLHGIEPGWYHLTNLFIHICSTLLLFAALKSMTAAPWRSAFVAAAFALHPLHVEPVTWISTRNHLLSSSFWMLTILAWARYVEKPAAGKYLLALLFFAFGLMSKPMVVTMPFVLLLLDYWPLERFEQKTLRRLVCEKIPFFILSGVLSVVTFFVSRSFGAMVAVDVISPRIRIANAFISYAKYIWKMLWPAGLAVHYPHPGQSLSMYHAVAAAVLLLAISVPVIRIAKGHGYLLTGWLWYLLTLVPVIGLVQAGAQAMADRYTYIPSIGIFIIVAWGMNELLGKWRYRRIILGISASIILLSWSVCCRYQLRFWPDSMSLFKHAIEVTKNNDVAQFGLAKAFRQQGKLDEAIEHYTEALRINPNYPHVHVDLGIALFEKGKANQAIEHFNQALQLKPDFADAHTNLGYALIRQGKFDEAAVHLRKAIALDPYAAKAHYHLAMLLARQDKIDETITHLRQAVAAGPNWLPAINDLAWILATNPDSQLRDPAEAIRLAERACELTNYQRPDLLNTLAAAYASSGKFAEAVTTAEKALQLAEPQGPNELTENIRNCLRLYRAGKPYIEVSEPDNG
jgi:tetratricopeptide (TPR) repeat protein